MARSAPALLCALCLAAGCGADRARGYVELSCPEDVAFRICHLTESPGVDRVSDVAWIPGRPMGQDVVQRFELPPGIAAFGARPESPLLDELERGLVDASQIRQRASDLAELERARLTSWLRFEVLVVEGFVTPVVVCPRTGRRGGFAVEVGELVPDR